MFEFSNKVLPSVKLALREASNDFDEDIKADIESCALDLENSGILFYFFDTSRENFEVDPLILRAVKWYCMSVYGLANPDMEKYDQAYRSLKATLATQARYRRDPDEKLRDAEIQEIRNLIRSLDLRIAGLEDIDTTLSSTSTNAVENRVVTENFARVDNEFIATNEKITEVESIALGAEKAITYGDYRQMVETLNALPKSFFKAGQGINIITMGVPDVWVAYVQDTSIPYTYTSDQVIADTLKTVGTLQIGYFVLAQKETQKVDLTDYAKKEQVPVVTATLKENGAYTLTITMGVD